MTTLHFLNTSSVHVHPSVIATLVKSADYGLWFVDALLWVGWTLGAWLWPLILAIVVAREAQAQATTAGAAAGALTEAVLAWLWPPKPTLAQRVEQTVADSAGDALEAAATSVGTSVGNAILRKFGAEL